MLAKLFIIVLFFASLALQSCNSVASQNSESEIAKIVPAEIKQQTPQPRKDEVPKQQKVEFKGVSFTYNPQIFGEVKTEEIEELRLEGETDKPDSVAPRHVLFKIKKSGEERESKIYVFPIEDFRRMFAVSIKTQKYFDEKIKDLKDAITNPSNKRDELMPRIPFWDGSQTAQLKLTQTSFQNGKGVFYLTQFDIEPSLLNNEGLTYCFQGITNDGKNYVLAEFAVKLPFLPESYNVSEFEGYKLPQYFYKEPQKNQKQYEKYVSNIAKRLQKVSQEEFIPNLNDFIKLISSLKIEK
jgi:hypothetical protein